MYQSICFVWIITQFILCSKINRRKGNFEAPYEVEYFLNFNNIQFPEPTSQHFTYASSTEESPKNLMQALQTLKYHILHAEAI